MGLLGDLANRIHNSLVQKAPYPVLKKQRGDVAARRWASLAKYVHAASKADFGSMARARRDVETHQESIAIIDCRLAQEFNDTEFADADEMTPWATAERRCAQCSRSYLGMIERCVICATDLPAGGIAEVEETSAGRSRPSTKKRTPSRSIEEAKQQVASMGRAMGNAALGDSMARTLEGMAATCPNCKGLVWVEADACGHCGQALRE